MKVAAQAIILASNRGPRFSPDNNGTQLVLLRLPHSDSSLAFNRGLALTTAAVGPTNNNTTTVE